ncbi:hypothetical protein TUM15778_05380 [Neisseria gonorrhoeae]|nr:hypothetical protein TUM19853C_02340 [Neisseria gonorrhoeae]BCD75448.1 hypothetical protein TUM19854C_12570 [Neisseria gonorrhoeae]BCD76591.1 hypothetical protein TUM15748C_02340 [Neisseria gonorrhoeae]BCD78878.1 hypothetical protein TUM15753C_02340 [Neisseria gonorrhoeae]BCD82120.1 hypothetical protein TUM16691C_12560 [Neisseria gonorrhoeae]
MMLAGGGEEFCPSEVYVFDSLYAASRRNGEPEETPRPYDANRDGLVIGEKARGFSYWKNWNTPNGAVRKFTPNSSATAPTATASISAKAQPYSS